MVRFPHRAPAPVTSSQTHLLQASPSPTLNGSERHHGGAQVPDFVLDRLALVTKPQSQAGGRRLRALAFLDALMRLYTGRRELRIKPRETMQALAERTRVQVSMTCTPQHV